MKSNSLSTEWNIYDWILSEEIREDWRRKPPLSLTEQAQIIRFAYRSVEEKLQAFEELFERKTVVKEELPEEQKALGAIAGEISSIRVQRGEEEAAGRFREIFMQDWK